MTYDQPIAPVLETLRVLYPPAGITIVGAGTGTSAWVGLLQKWQAAQRQQEQEQEPSAQVILIEADDRAFKALQQTIPPENGWQLLHAAIAAQSGEQTFYTASNSSENGLLQPEALRPILPNLHTLAEQTKPTQSLPAAWLQLGITPRNHWLIIDCLPALPILDALSVQELEQVDVIVARALLQAPASMPEGTSQEELQNVLREQGFQALVIEAGRHPAIAHALHARDPKAILQTQANKYTEQQKRQADAVKQLTQAKEALEKQNKEQAAELERAAKNQEAQAKQLAQVTNARNEQVKLAKERQTEIEKLIQDALVLKQKNDGQTKLNKEWQQKNEKLTFEKERLAAEKKNIEEKNPGYSDANIDEFLNDITPFFFRRSITYVDVGAFEGKIPLKIIDHGKINIREAHLFEPNPESFKKLEENLKDARISRINLYNHAIGSQEKELTFRSAESMTKVIDIPQSGDNQLGIFSTHSQRLDVLEDLFTDHHIDLLKIDVEGFETDVIEGAKELLKKQKIDIIYIEVGFNKKGTQQTYFGEIDVKLQEFGYRVFRIYEQNNEWISDSPLLRRCNFAYMSKQFASSNPFKAQKEILKLKEEIDQLKKAAKGVTQ